MVNTGRASLVCPSDIETYSLISGETFYVTLSRLKKINGDFSRLWYQYTKNRPFDVVQPTTVQVSNAPPPAPFRTGSLNSVFLIPSIDWISFGGDVFSKAPLYFVDCGQVGIFNVRNIHDEVGLAATLPQYQLHFKHRENPYYDYERKEHVAAMPIRDDSEAGILLRNGLPDGSDIISYHRITNRIFRFKLTGGNVYHGFQIEFSEAAPNVLKELMR